MNNQQALEFIREYFDELFVKRNLDALDVYMDKDYFDDDYGVPDADHVQNAREYLTAVFKERPTIGVDVHEALVRDDVISAYLDWTVCEDGVKRVIRKGVAIFVVKNEKIVHRHTFAYFVEQA